MENASKALIIAGAILLSILIIALGIYVFNMAKNASSTSSLDELEVSQYNQQFTNYKGKQLGASVIDLLDKVVANASANKEADERLPDVIFIGKSPNGNDGKQIGASTISYADQTEKDAIKAITSLSWLDNKTVGFVVKSTGDEANIATLGKVRQIIAKNHYYKVGFVNNNESGLIEYIIINYDS